MDQIYIFYHVIFKILIICTILMPFSCLLKFRSKYRGWTFVFLTICMYLFSILNKYTYLYNEEVRFIIITSIFLILILISFRNNVRYKMKIFMITICSFFIAKIISYFFLDMIRNKIGRAHV